MALTKVIGKCPRDGREWDCQCARCGSSCIFNDCDNCGGDGEIEDDDWQCEGEFYRCDWCRGDGGFWTCGSSPEWCEANPRENLGDVKRGAIEWFTFDVVDPVAPARKVSAVDPHVGSTRDGPSAPHSSFGETR